MSYADDLEGLLTAGRPTNDNNSSYQRQVSNSAPSTTVDIEGLVRDELIREQELMRDRRKKDVHNMSEFNLALFVHSCTRSSPLRSSRLLS